MLIGIKGSTSKRRMEENTFRERMGVQFQANRSIGVYNLNKIERIVPVGQPPTLHFLRNYGFPVVVVVVVVIIIIKKGLKMKRREGHWVGEEAKIGSMGRRTSLLMVLMILTWMTKGTVYLFVGKEFTWPGRSSEGGLLRL